MSSGSFCPSVLECTRRPRCLSGCQASLFVRFLSPRRPSSSAGELMHWSFASGSSAPPSCERHYVWALFRPQPVMRLWSACPGAHLVTSAIFQIEGIPCARPVLPRCPFGLGPRPFRVPSCSRLCQVPKTCIGGSGTRTSAGLSTSCTGRPTCGWWVAVTTILCVGAALLRIVSISIWSTLMSFLRKFRFRFGCRVLLGADVPSDGFQAVQHSSGTTVACLCLACQVWRVCQTPDLLTQWAIDASCALGRSFHLWFLLALLGLLSRPLGWRSSPIGKLLQQLCIHGTPPCHCLAVCAQAFPMQARYGSRFQRLSSRHRPDVHAWLGSFERCRPCESARKRHTATIGLRACSALRGLLGFMLWSQPVIVWAAPPGLGEALADIEAMVAAMPEVPIAPGNAAPAARSVDQEVQPNLVGPPPDSPGPIQERSWFDIVAEVQQDSLREAGFRDPRHPLAGQVLPVERYVPGLPPHEVPRRLRCHSYVVSPGYVPELSQLTWTLPCETKDAEYLVSKYLRHDTFPFAGLVVAAQPQPSSDFATFLAIPAWVTYSGLSGVVLDLRASTIGRDGPVIGALLSRPTTAAEIRREAGLFSTGPCSILVGSSNGAPA